MKDNEYLQFGIMTGILRIAKEGIFSGLNNLKVNTIFSEKYSEYYGLTEEEVLEAVKYYDMEYEMQDIRKWYDGYQFGKSEVYNPWSIINFLNERELKAYWIGVSGNSMINDLLSKGNRHIVENLEKLFNEEIIYKVVRDYTEYKFDSSDIWELFLYSGYLTIAGEKQGEEYPLRLPNKEIQSFFRKIFIEKFIGNYYSQNIVETNFGLTFDVDLIINEKDTSKLENYNPEDEEALKVIYKNRHGIFSDNYKVEEQSYNKEAEKTEEKSKVRCLKRHI